MLTSKAKQQGFGLIEVLVAGFIVTFGLVGMMLMQGHTQRDAFNAHHLTLAGLYSQDLQERLRANVCHLQSIQDDPNNIENWLESQLESWQTKHLTGSRSGWSSDLNIGKQDDGTTNWNDDEAEKRGYWRFDLELCYAQCNAADEKDRKRMTQRLLLQYRSGDCNA